ncbi:MAG: 3-methyl-2-oxobutanoate dehydrogenase subunit VorB [Spirochaetota bacterium]|nr:3-methyl-2-oxobutanoate dehydrogenase subunit VorB [Spirochaetota bacterium]
MAKKTLEKGNIAIAKGAISAGCKYYFGYPITPQNDIPEYLSGVLPKIGGTFIQAESEIASINMVMGASAAGARVMTSSSGPGISLKQEGISYMAGSELPALIVNIMRVGPGLGGIAATQGDYFQATRGGGHGDYYVIVLAPGSVQEMYDCTIKAFDLADKYRNPVMILSDAILGQMKEPVIIEDVEPAVPPVKDWALTGPKGRPPQFIKTLYLSDGEQEQHNLELKKKYDTIRREEVLYESKDLEDSDIVIVAFGTLSRIAKTALQMAKKENLKVGLIRPITLFPFPSDIIRETAKRVPRILVAEMNTGQMIEDVRLAIEDKVNIRLYYRPGGGSITPEDILNEVKVMLNE